MENQEPGEPCGNLVISDEVLAAIAITAAKEVNGVSALMPRNDITRLLHSESQRYVRLSGGEGDVSMQLAVRIRAGACISTVAGELQKEIKNAVQSMTGRTVAKVNIYIAGADF